jgi:excisionase family DNA binding protein
MVVSEAQRPVPRLALTRAEAASSLGMSVDSFERYVQPSLRVIRQGRLRLIPVAELEKWVRENSEPVFQELAA